MCVQFRGLVGEALKKIILPAITANYANVRGRAFEAESKTLFRTEAQQGDEAMSSKKKTVCENNKVNCKIQLLQYHKN